MTSADAATDELLAGLLVLDLSRALAGPHAAMMLGDLGARVIKVESIDGDDSRSWGPPFLDTGDGRESTYFFSANRNKESIVLDLKAADGQRCLRRLVERADVLIENFRVGVLDRLGFPHAHLHELNPRLVILSITGFGHDGPEGHRPGYDQIAQGEAGLMSITGPAGGEPTKVGIPIADLLAGINGAFGAVAALYERSSTGRGRIVRTSLLAAIVSAHAFQGTRWTVAKEVPTSTGAHHPSIAPYGLFPTGTEPIQVACGSQTQWLAFAEILRLDVSGGRFATNQDRVAHRPELITAISDVLRRRSGEYWISRLEAAGVPAGRVRTLDEVYGWEQTRSQGLLIDVDHASVGRITLPGPALRFDSNAFAGARREHAAPPILDQHGDEIRTWLDRD
jgi:crotonobetainyl-CoA:carnitine CoA-transferase CaiB-like acyl-CoA transferase